MAKYSNGDIVEMSLISALVKGGSKIKIHSMEQSVEELKEVLMKHAPGHWHRALPHLERKGMYSDEIWDIALHTDLVANYKGWLIAIDVTTNPSKVDDKLGNHLQVKDCLLKLGVDRSLVLLINESEETPNWRADLEVIMTDLIKQQSFAHTAELNY